MHPTEQDHHAWDTTQDNLRNCEVGFVSPPSVNVNAWKQIRATEMANQFTCEACFDVSGIKIAVNKAIANAGATANFVTPDAPLTGVVTS